MSLKTIEEHNKDVCSNSNDATGVACPQCGSELQFVDTTVMLSSPPQKYVKCFKCGYKTSIYVRLSYH